MNDLNPTVRQFGKAGELITPTLFLGGRLELVQPKAGYRAGIDPILLAAAVPVLSGRSVRILDAGAGIGAIGLALAWRITDAQVTLVEREPELAEMAAWNVTHNQLAARVRVIEADLTAQAGALAPLGLQPESQDIVVTNPPYLEQGASQSPKNALRAASHQMPDGGLEAWIRFAARMLTARGMLVMINRTDTLPMAMAALAGRFGAIEIVPIHSRADEPAKRMFIKGIKGSRAPLSIRPGLIVHEGPDDAFRPVVKAASSEGAHLDLFSGAK